MRFARSRSRWPHICCSEQSQVQLSRVNLFCHCQLGRRVLRIVATAVCVQASPTTSLGCEGAAPWSHFPATARESFSPLPLSLIASSVVPPAAMAPTGADYQLRLVSQRDLHGKPNAEPVSVWTPYLLPVVVAGVDAVAHMTEHCETARDSSAMLQAMGISFVLVTSLKVVTGRSWPSGGLDPRSPGYLDHPEFARRFHWFSWNQGTAWPSGHTTIMVAAATALSTTEYGRSWVGYAAYAAAGGVAAGMWLGDHHWMSDVISGGLLGVAVGRSVGLAFRDGTAARDTATWSLLPIYSGSMQGLQLAAVW
jgi:membrane-associated phospholipid phosphatase